MSDMISRQAAWEITAKLHSEFITIEQEEILERIDEMIEQLPSAQPEIIRCKDCKKAPKCYGDVVMRSKGGGNIYCPLTYCSEAERRTDGSD